jgi:hypothetical protein
MNSMKNLAKDPTNPCPFAGALAYSIDRGIWHLLSGPGPDGGKSHGKITTHCRENMRKWSENMAK